MGSMTSETAVRAGLRFVSNKVHVEDKLKHRLQPILDRRH